MQIISYVAASLAILSFAGAAARSAFAESDNRVSSPHSYENLTVYFIHGPSAPGPVPLTLQEALENGNVRLLETGTVNELKIENTGDRDVFIQAGDIVKGGKQDRVLAMSFVLPPKSGEVELSAFCVEQGRWAARGAENVAAFASAAEAMPSRKAKLAMHAPVESASRPDAAGSARGSYVRGLSRQEKVWEQVASTQANLAAELSAPVASPRSATSLQLSLENEELQKARTAYLEALQGLSGEKEDIVGYAFAINGRISSADVYPSNALFRKMWAKQLKAAVTEAIGASTDERPKPPTTADVVKFLAAAEKPKSEEQVANAYTRQAVRNAEKTLYVEARRADGSWVHRNYLAK